MTREQRRAELRGKTKAQLIAMCKTGVPNHRGGKTTIWGGADNPLETWTRDDLTASIIDVMFPPAYLLDPDLENLS